MEERVLLLETKISYFLRFGAYTSGALLFTSMLAFLFNLSWAHSVGTLGLFSLICTPVLRVLLTSVVFLLEKEFTMFVIAFSVLVLLVSSFVFRLGL